MDVRDGLGTRLLGRRRVHGEMTFDEVCTHQGEKVVTAAGGAAVDSGRVGGGDARPAAARR